MSGFAGFFDATTSFIMDPGVCLASVRRMGQRIAHRGKGGHTEVISDFYALTQRYTSSETPHTEVEFQKDGFDYIIGLDGHPEVTKHLDQKLRKYGMDSARCSGAELVLQTYLYFGMDCAKELTGQFAFVLIDTKERYLLLCRDRLGVKPLYFAQLLDRWIFGSEIKALLEYPGIRPKIGKTGLQELLGMGPVHTPGAEIFCGIREVKPGSYCVITSDGLQETTYYRLSQRDTQDISVAERIDRIRKSVPTDYSSLHALHNLPSRRSDFENWTEAILARDLPGTAAEDTKLLQWIRRSSAAGFSASEFLLSGVLDDKQYALTDGAYADFFTPLLHPEIAEYLQLVSYSAEHAAKRTHLLRQLPLDLPHILERLDRCFAFCGADLDLHIVTTDLIENLYSLPSGTLSLSELRSALIPPDCSAAWAALSAVTESDRQRVLSQFHLILRDRDQPLHRLFRKDALMQCAAQDDSFDCIAYLLQLNLWMVRYNIRIVL